MKGGPMETIAALISTWLPTEIAPSGGTQWTDSELPMGFETKSGARGAFVWSG
jgi:hypothetical protein